MLIHTRSKDKYKWQGEVCGGRRDTLRGVGVGCGFTFFPHGMRCFCWIGMWSFYDGVGRVLCWRAVSVLRASVFREACGEVCMTA